MRGGEGMEYRILGPIEVVDAQGARVDVGGPKQRALLALLLCEAGRVVSLDRIIDELWGDEPPPTATGTLQAYVSVLRRALEPGRKPREPARMLLTTPPGYRLEVDPAKVDARRFEQLLGEAGELLAAEQAARAEALLDEALALWRGDPLADVAHEGFAQAEIARLTELRYAALEARAAARLALGRHATVIPELEQLIAEHPLREGLRAHLILALYQAGRQADALAAYQETRRMLADELGIDPSPELQQLESDILSQSDRIKLRPREQLAAPLPPVPPPPAAPVPPERPFVGRAREIEQLEQAVARALSGAGGLVLISGEAGVGKTSVAEAITEHARAHGMFVYTSSCPEGQSSVPFWPWIQIGRAVRDTFEQLGSDVSGVSDLLHTDVSAMLSEDPVEAEAARFRLYELTARDIEARAAIAPGFFLIDDLQWADRSSLHLLRFLVPRLAKLRLLIVATFRVEEVEPGDPLDEAVGWMMRERNVERIHLRGLDAADVAAYLAAVGTRTEGGLPAVLHERTDGNPFYLIELVRLLTSEGLIGAERSALPLGMEGVPLSVQEVIRRRLARLPEGTRAILGVASIVGREFAIDLVAEAARLDLDEALDLLEPALVTGVLTEDPQPVRLRFSHALVRDVARASLPAVQRARLHLRVGEALEKRYADALDAPVSELAHHFWHAMSVGGADRALSYARAAAERATASLAYDEAVQHWNYALTAVEAARPGDADARMDVLFSLGLALRRNGDVAGGWQRMEELIDLATRAGDDERALRAAISFGGIDLWNWRDYGEVNERVVALLEHALTWVPARAPELLARVFATLAVELAYGDRRAEAESYGMAAVELTRDGGYPLAHARALNAFFLATWRPGTEPKRLEAADEYLSLSEVMSEELEGVGRLHRLFLRLRAADLPGANEDLARLRALFPRVADPDLRAQMTCVEMTRAIMDARWKDAGRIREQLDDILAGTSLWGFDWVRIVQRLTIARQRGVAPASFDGFEQLAAVAGTELMRPLYALGLVEAGRLDQARRIVDAGPPVVADDWAWEFTTVVWAEVAAALGTPDPEPYVALLEPLADVIVVAGTTIACWGSMHGTLGRLANALGNTEQAIEHLRAALALDEQLRAPGIEARTRLDLGAALVAAGRRDEAAEVLGRARELAERYALRGLPPRIEQLLV